MLNTQKLSLYNVECTSSKPPYSEPSSPSIHSQHSAFESSSRTKSNATALPFIKGKSMYQIYKEREQQRKRSRQFQFQLFVKGSDLLIGSHKQQQLHESNMQNSTLTDDHQMYTTQNIQNNLNSPVRHSLLLKSSYKFIPVSAQKNVRTNSNQHVDTVGSSTAGLCKLNRRVKARKLKAYRVETEPNVQPLGLSLKDIDPPAITHMPITNKFQRYNKKKSLAQNRIQVKIQQPKPLKVKPEKRDLQQFSPWVQKNGDRFADAFFLVE